MALAKTIEYISLRLVESLKYYSLLAVVFLFSIPSSGQEIYIDFADSTSLDRKVWQGTLDLFKLQEGGLKLSDPNPSNTYNQAWLGNSFPNAPQLSWCGSIHFQVKPTRQNRFDILLYPLASSVGSKGELKTYYIALSVGDTPKAELHKVSVTEDEKSGRRFHFSERTTVIKNDHPYQFSEKITNRLDYCVTFDSASKLWQLFVRNYNHYGPPQFQLIGSANYDGSYDYIDSKLLANRVVYTYSKKNAEAFLLRTLQFHTKIVNPLENELETPSIIEEVRYDGHALLLLCRASPHVDQASFVLDPLGERLTPLVEGLTIRLPLRAPLAKGDYKLHIEGLFYPDGTPSPAETFEFKLSEEEELPDNEKKARGLKLSEVMPYPQYDGAEFIELYNSSDQAINLSEYAFLIRKEGHLKRLLPIQENEAYSLLPNSYVVLTPWREGLIRQFPSLDPTLVLEMKKFPELNNKEGQLVLYHQANDEMVEMFNYDYAYYAPSKKKKRGYSLERMSYERAAHDRDNWYAARKEVGFATPGEPNSVMQANPWIDKFGKGKITLQKIAMYVQGIEKKEGSKLRIIFYTPQGERVTDWHHERVRLWARQLLGEDTAWLADIPYKDKPILMHLQVREGGQGKIKNYTVKLVAH